MASKILKLSPKAGEQFAIFLENNLHECVSALEHGGVLVFPTETLYGLGVDISNDHAIDKLIQLKQRPEKMPIAIAVSDLAQAEAVAEISKFAKKLINNCMPKPITILLPVKENVSQKLTGGSELIGLRFPDNPITKAVIRSFGPITATSANLHGSKNPVTMDMAFLELGEDVEIYIDTGPCRFGEPSTVIDTTGDTIKIIRDGACSGEELEECLKRS
jgi:L-threonylcarbamoyladenylate synthase